MRPNAVVRIAGLVGDVDFWNQFDVTAAIPIGITEFQIGTARF